ncbi:TIGR03943 family protein [Leucobacter sp. CSA1]|uniref:TIGR03943 family protein n=1 Tax=Leucobacter chromiisoli TaxID=2796471 RepID=A0A934Q584_9MICO|nr:TIGR03943 family protein [Leucobacter chromiisoli]
MLTHWKGLLLSSIGIAASCWLAFSGRLGWYVHPRYFAFTVVMMAIAAVAVLAAFAVLGVRGAEADADATPDAEPRPAPARWRGWGTVVLITATAVALLVLPPATLTTSTAEQRQMNASVTTGAGMGGAGSDAAGAAALAVENGEDLNVRDWSLLLRRGDPGAVTGVETELVGFVLPDEEDPENLFYVSRFVVTCCAVDAQPVGVPVYMPGWQESFATDDWVSVAGVFAPNPSAASAQPVALRAAEAAGTEAPEDPYVY